MSQQTRKKMLTHVSEEEEDLFLTKLQLPAPKRDGLWIERRSESPEGGEGASLVQSREQHAKEMEQHA